MKIHICCLAEDSIEEIIGKKVHQLKHTLVECGSDADVILVVVTMNNYRSVMNWVPVLWDLKPTIPVIFIESDYPNRIYGSLEANFTIEQLDKALRSVYIE